ncbi:MAG: hypothetical protein H7644_09565 [Candidatus Heimdallarchaeota archaeon]|nr:hypothetical protein [Candidatus Heimdallarchaeota archaeon]MCK5144001.1 hypothetical protein [Candidatus Heimdallarchaeota archaeon]
MNKENTSELNLENIKSFRIVIEAGYEAFAYGLTKIVLNGSGAAVIENTLKEKKISFSSKLSEKEVLEIFSQKILKNIWEIKFIKRKGIPDESLIKLSLFYDEKKVKYLEMWEGILEEHPETSWFIVLLREILKRITEKSERPIYL